MLFPRLAIVDLETTGADPSRDRITEIAILLTDGNTLLETWSTLVNPGMPIPARIQTLIGITDAMVADAPTFPEIADTVRAKLSDAVFVAHNARFDYGFLRAAFEAERMPWDAPVMCSVKFSRALDPEHSRHGLDALIARGGYTIDARHRALDDAQIVWRFLQDAQARADDARLQKAWDKAYSTGTVPRLPRGDLEALPDSPGAYLFRGATGQILQIGRARDLRSQVLGLFTATRTDAKSKRLAASVHEVETWPCAGELGAQLQELSLQQTFKDAPPTQALGWQWQKDSPEPPVLTLVDLHGTDPAAWHQVFGNFRGEREARTALQEMARQHRLCAARIGLELATGPCQAAHLGRCNGVCAGKESPRLHDLRLATALAALRLRAWPWPGPVLIPETHAASARAETHLFDHWCHLGSARSEAELAELLAQPPARRFDADICRLLQRWLNTHEHLAAVQSVPPRQSA